MGSHDFLSSKWADTAEGRFAHSRLSNLYWWDNLNISSTQSNQYTSVTPVFPKKTKCKPICMPGSSFMHIVTYKCIQKQYHVRKREIIRVLRFILETKDPNITGSLPGVAYA
jgi:hypothetical protein